MKSKEHKCIAFQTGNQGCYDEIKYIIIKDQEVCSIKQWSHQNVYLVESQKETKESHVGTLLQSKWIIISPLNFTMKQWYE